MAGTTPRRALPYPTNGDAPNVAGDIAALATAVDLQLGSRGKSIVSASEAVSGAAVGTWVFAPTPDRVQGLVLPSDALIFVAFEATWRMASNASSNVALAAIFIGANQLKGVQADSAAPVVQQASLAAPGTPPTNVAALHSFAGGLASVLPPGSGYTGDVTTGQVVGSYDPASDGAGAVPSRAGAVAIFAAAGTYDVGVKYSKGSGSAQPTVNDRKLWVWTLPF